MGTEIKYFKAMLNKQRELIIGINNAIEKDGFRPSPTEQLYIKYIQSQGLETFKKVERLERSLNSRN